MLRVCFLSCTVQVCYGAQVGALCDGVIDIFNIGYGGSRIETVESFGHTLYVSMYALIMNKLV